MIVFKGLNKKAVKVSLSQMAYLEFAFKYSGAKPKVCMCQVCIWVWADGGASSDQSTLSSMLIIEARWWVLNVLFTFVYENF